MLVMLRSPTSKEKADMLLSLAPNDRNVQVLLHLLMKILRNKA